MELVYRWSAAPHSLLDCGDKGLALAFADGLALFDGDQLHFLARGPIDAMTRGPDGRIYWTQSEDILCCDLVPGADAQLMSSAFAGHPMGKRQITCTPDGDIWVEGCSTRRRLDGRFSAVPAFPAGWSPVPSILDIYGNFWSLSDGYVLVLPANAAHVWQSAWINAGPWEYLVADSVGYIWLIGAEGVRQFCPRKMADGWRAVENPLTQTITAVGRSPDELLMAALANGQLVQLAADAAGQVQVKELATLPAAARCVLSDRHGALWLATDDGLYRQEPQADAWQHTWEKKWGRLPGGGNHDIFSVPCKNKLYVAGGWAGEWGLPPSAHVLDELFAYDSRSEYWQVCSHMQIPRRYNGIAALDGCVWVVGGETRIAGWAGEGQVLYTVEIYDPLSETWRPGPSLNIARTDPFVLSCNGRIYAIGGAAHNAGPKLDSVESIGPGEDAWRIEAPLPEPTRQGHACSLDGIIYCASIDGVFAFDTSNGCWQQNLPQPGPIGQAPLAAAYENEVWLIGGYQDQRIRCYNPRTRSWRAGPDLPTEQAWGAASVIDDQLIIVGGAHFAQECSCVVFDDRTYVLRAEKHTI